MGISERHLKKDEIDMTVEPFKTGMPVIWHAGEELGEFLAPGIIVDVLGNPYVGTLVCEFEHGTQKETFMKKDGRNVNGNGFIRLID